MTVNNRVVENYFEGDLYDIDDEIVINDSATSILELYEDENHLGYNKLGEKIIKKIDNKTLSYLANINIDEDWKKIIDPFTQKTYALTDEEIELIRRIKNGKLGLKVIDDNDFVIETEWLDNEQPVTVSRISKKRYLPSAAEEKKIQKIIKLIKSGKPYKPIKKEKNTSIIDLWNDNITYYINNKNEIIYNNMTTLEKKLPTHAESYNPPTEYLFNDEQKETWDKQNEMERLYDFIPTQYSSLRHVTTYDNLIKERFLHCLDLYLCPRIIDTRSHIDYKDLLPELQPLDHYKPFPNNKYHNIEHYLNQVQSLAVSETLGYIAAGYSNGSIAIYDVSISPYQCAKFFIKSTSQNTNNSIDNIRFIENLPMLIFTRNSYLYICIIKHPNVTVECIKKIINQQYETMENSTQYNNYIKVFETFFKNNEAIKYIEKFDDNQDTKQNEMILTNGAWRQFRNKLYFDKIINDDILINEAEIEVEEDDEDAKILELKRYDWKSTCEFIDILTNANTFLIAGFVVNIKSACTNLDINPKGAYIITTSPKSNTNKHSCLLHHIGKKTSVLPIRSSGSSEKLYNVSFHKTKPWVIFGYNRRLIIYDLLKKEKLLQYFTKEEQVSMYVGDNYVLRGSKDGVFYFYDFDYPTNPYKIIRLEKCIINSISQHDSLPLVALGTYDYNAKIFKTETEDFVQLLHISTNEFGPPDIVPLVRLKIKSPIVSLCWFTKKHWLITGQKDGSIRIWL